MREPLKTLFKKTIIHKWKLPNDLNDIEKINLSDESDYCYSSSCNEDISKVIYNAIIDYAYDEKELKEQDPQKLHSRALLAKLKYNPSVSTSKKLGYGFYGEVMLYCLLLLEFGAVQAIARGHFYNVLENSETKGYDSYQLIEKEECLELWFGEAKFYQGQDGYKKATTGEGGALKNLSKVISDNYLNKNLLAISEQELYLTADGSALKPVLTQIKDNPEIKISEIAKTHNIKLVYPILILFDQQKCGYEEAIKNIVSHIQDNSEEMHFSLTIEKSIFFILIEVNDTKSIKTKVLEWIDAKEQLMS